MSRSSPQPGQRATSVTTRVRAACGRPRTDSPIGACVRRRAAPAARASISGSRCSGAGETAGYADDYSFGVLQSTFHWIWFINRCSTLKGDPRYTSNTVFDTFP